jgi:hypothetical protein
MDDNFYDDVPASQTNDQFEMAKSVFATGPAPGSAKPKPPIPPQAPAPVTTAPIEDNMPEMAPAGATSEGIPDIVEVEVIDDAELKEVSVIKNGSLEPGIEVKKSHKEERAIVPREDKNAIFAVDPMSPEALEKGLEIEEKKRALIVKFIQKQLIDGVDYGAIEGETKSGKKFKGKKCLWKPGAEKICSLLHLKPVFSKDEEAFDMLGDEYCKRHGVIAYKCHLISSTGEVLAEGRGARNAVTQEKGDTNKAIKMAEKSAQVDATLRMAGLSDQFTQDLEDQHPELQGPAPGAKKTTTSGGNNYQKYLDHFMKNSQKATELVANYLVEIGVTSANDMTAEQFGKIKAQVDSL